MSTLDAVLEVAPSASLQLRPEKASPMSNGLYRRARFGEPEEVFTLDIVDPVDHIGPDRNGRGAQSRMYQLNELTKRFQPCLNNCRYQPTLSSSSR